MDLGEANVEVDDQGCEVVVARGSLHYTSGEQINTRRFTSFHVVSNERSSFLHVMMSMNFNWKSQYHPSHHH